MTEIRKVIEVAERYAEDNGKPAAFVVMSRSCYASLAEVLADCIPCPPRAVYTKGTPPIVSLPDTLWPHGPTAFGNPDEEAGIVYDFITEDEP